MNDKIPNMNYDADEVIENFKSQFKKKPASEVETVVKPPKLILNLIISFLITAVIGAGLYYVMLPVFNLKSTDFYVYIVALIAIFMGIFGFIIKANKKIERREYLKKSSKVPIIIIIVLVVIMLIGYLVGATIFRASSYSKMMEVSSSDFDTDFKDIEYNKVPRLDDSTARTLADQQLGQLSEYKSQYVVSNTSSLINYKGSPVRVAYLEYADFFKWWNNTKGGLPAYMVIDVVSQKVEVVDCIEKFGSGITYSPTELFNEKLVRHLRFQYPTAILDTSNFEVDETGHPYWITPVLDKTIGLFGGTDVKGAIITDALTGDSNYYDMKEVRENKELSWIDIVYSDYLLIQQYNYNGKLTNGFWNSIIFQNDVNVASSGNGYIAMDNDVWVYTGVSSIKEDTSNFGFILSNQRTKETKFYKNSGTMESAAQQSAQDAVQNYGYNAIFPILLDIEGQPSYFMSLYGSGNTIKGYALVNLDDKTLVGTGLTDVEKSDKKALDAAVTNYIDALKDKNMIDSDVTADDYVAPTENDEPTQNSDDKAVSGKITDIKSSVNNGNTVYYLQVNKKYYYIDVVDAMDVLLMKKGDEVVITFDKDADTFVKATSVKAK